MDLEEDTQLIPEQQLQQPKQPKKSFVVKSHPLDATCNSFITLMVAILSFLFILMVLDLSGFIQLKQVHAFGAHHAKIETPILPVDAATDSAAKGSQIKFKVAVNDKKTKQTDDDVPEEVKVPGKLMLKAAEDDAAPTEQAVVNSDLADMADMANDGDLVGQTPKQLKEVDLPADASEQGEVVDDPNFYLEDPNPPAAIAEQTDDATNQEQDATNQEQDATNQEQDATNQEQQEADFAPLTLPDDDQPEEKKVIDISDILSKAKKISKDMDEPQEGQVYLEEGEKTFVDHNIEDRISQKYLQNDRKEHQFLEITRQFE